MYILRVFKNLERERGTEDNKLLSMALLLGGFDKETLVPLYLRLVGISHLSSELDNVLFILIILPSGIDGWISM